MGLVLTSDDGLLYVASAATNSIELFTATGDYVDPSSSVAAVSEPSDVAISLDDDLLYAVNILGNSVEVLDNLGNSLLSIPGVDPPNGEAKVILSIDDGSYVVTNFGRMPLYGDCNCDGSINGLDIDPFVVALVDTETYIAAYADCDGNGSINGLDIDPFVAILTGG